MPSSADWTKRIMKLMKRKPPPMTCVVVCNPGIAFTCVLHGAKTDFSCEINKYNKRGRHHVKMYATRCKGAQNWALRGGANIEVGHSRARRGAEDFDARAGGQQPVVQRRGEDGVGTLGLRDDRCAGVESQQAAVDIRKPQFTNLPRKMPCKDRASNFALLPSHLMVSLPAAPTKECAGAVAAEVATVFAEVLGLERRGRSRTEAAGVVDDARLALAVCGHGEEGEVVYNMET